MRKIFFMALAFSLLVGSDYAVAVTHADTNNLSSVKLQTNPEISTLTLTFKSPGFKFTIEPNVENKTYSIVIPDSGYGGALDYKVFKDERIKDVAFSRPRDGSTVVKIILRDMKTSIFRSVSEDGLNLSLRFKGMPTMMSIKTESLSPEEMKLIAQKEEQEAKESERKLKESGRWDFKSAMDDYMAGQYKPAAAKLSAFIQNYTKSVFLEKAYYMRAEALYMSGTDKKTLAATIDAFSAAINTFPDADGAARAKLRLADIYYANGMEVEALPVYDSLVKGVPDSKYMVQALLGRAKVFIATKLYYEASNELEKILLFYPKSPEVREAKFKIAESFYLTGKYEDALKVFDSSIKRWPDYLMNDKDALYHYASANYKLKKLDRAKELFGDVMNLYPDSHEGKEALNRLAEIYMAKGDNAAATKLLGMQARKFPETEEGMRSRLKLASLGQKPEKLLSKADALMEHYPAYFDPMAAYNDIIKKHPDEGPVMEAMYQKALLFYKKKMYLDSIGTVNALMNKYPDLSRSRQLLDLVKASLSAMVRAFHDQGGSYEALHTYYNNFDPYMHDITDFETRLAVADAYYEMGIYTRAAEKYSELATSPGTAPYIDRIYYGWGRATAAVKKYDEAASILQKFSRLIIMSESVYTAPAMYALGGVYENLNKPQRAIVAYKSAIATDPRGDVAMSAMYRIGMLQKEGGKYDEAIRSFSSAIKKYKPLPGYNAYMAQDAPFQMAECAYRGKKYDMAVKYVDAAVKENPASPKASWARYVRSDSEAALSQDEKSAETLRALAKSEPPPVYKNVALASVGNSEWKENHADLF
jgi:TolA-binding protein